MNWQAYDHGRKSWYYYDASINTYVYKNGLRVAGATPVPGNGGSVQAQTASYPTSGPSHGRGPSGASNDSSITSAFSTLSLGNYNVAPGSLNTDTASYYNHPPTVRTDSDGSYVAVNHAYTPTQASGYMITQASYTPYQQPEVDSQTSGYTHSTSPTHIARPSDGELLQNVGREVVLNPDAHNTPPDFPLLSKGLWPHRILRGSQGTHSSKEKLKPSFQIRYPGYRFYRRGVVFRVLWPELAGDVGQNITIATTGAFGEQTYYKIRWFVVIREGHNCCTCLPIQTYGGRGVPENKANGHHAIMYTGPNPPPSTPSEVAPTEPPMGEPIRVIGNKPWNTMDPMSRVNFVKLYTVEHNVKVEDFGHVDPNNEWKLMAQFKSHWGIEIAGPLPPAKYSKFYDGDTFGPAPSNSRLGAYASSCATTAQQQSSYDASLATPTPTMHNVQPNHVYQDTGPGAPSHPAYATQSESNYPRYSTSSYQPYPQSNSATYAASANPDMGYAAPHNVNYGPSHNTTYFSPVGDDELYDEHRQTPRPHRPSEAKPDRNQRPSDQRRRK